MTTHCTDQELLSLLGGTAPAHVVDHVDRCERCKNQLDDLAFDALLDDPETHLLADELSGSSSRLNENIRIAQLCAEEDAEAEERLRPYLRNPAKIGWTTFLRMKHHRTAGMVRVLCKAANERCEQRPLEARIIADSAAAIADALPVDHYLGSGIYLLRGLAWKEKGNARHALGQFDPALECFDHADRAYERVEGATLERAIVNYCRGRAFSQSERYAQALDALAQSEAGFVARRDVVRYIDCQLETGNTQFRRGETAEALRLWQAIDAHAEATNDVLLQARVAQNLGWAYLRLGEWNTANTAFQRALDHFVHVSKDAHVVRCRWGLARTTFEVGDANRGIEYLQRARRECEQYRMLDEEMLVSLDLAEALLRAGRVDESHRLCKSLVRHFREAGLQNSALRALEYLRMAALRKILTRSVIGLVQEFVERVAFNPTLRFVPPSSS